MPYKKQIKNISKKIIISLVGILTVISMTGGPALAAAPTVSSVTVTTTSAQVVFDQNVVTDGPGAANYDKSAMNLSNYTLWQPTGTLYPLHGEYGHFTDYFVSGAQEGVATIFGLGLTQGQTWKMQIQNIASAATVTEVMDGVTTSGLDAVAASTDPVIYKIENTTAANNPCYGYPCGKAGEQITITGVRFNIAASGVEVSGIGTTQTVTTSNADAIVMNIPGDAPNGNLEVKVKNRNDNAFSNAKYFGVYSASCGVIKGKLTNSAGAVGSDQNDVFVRLESWHNQYGNTISHNNGFYAVVGYSDTICQTGSFDVFFTTSAGSSEAAPTEVGSQTVTAGSVTNAGTKAFATANVTGYVKDPAGNVGIRGGGVNVHNDSWSVNQRANTNNSGFFKAYVPTTNTSNYYWIKAEPGAFYGAAPYNYQAKEIAIIIPQDGTVLDQTINLTTINVTGTVMTPIAESEQNPYPDTEVSNAHVMIFTPDWSRDYHTMTDNNGQFKFGEVESGTNYMLVIDGLSGNFTVYPSTQFTNVVIGSANTDAYSEGVTNLNNDKDGVAPDEIAIRLKVPNVFGRVMAGENPVSNVWTWLEDSRGWRKGTIQTDNAGKFRFYVPSTGTYRLHIDAPAGYSNYDEDKNIDSLPKNLGDITLSAPNVTGKIYDPTGLTPQANIGIDICPYNAPGMCYWGQTDANGAFGIGTVPDGTWQMQIRIQGTSVYAAPATIILTIAGASITATGGATNLNDIRLADPAVNGLLGQVVNPLGVGARANLMLRVPGMMMGGNEQWANSDDSGNFAFGTVSAGTYELEVMPDWNSDYSRAMYTITVDADGVVSSSNTGFTYNSKRNIKVSLKTPNITGTLKTPVTGCTELGLDADTYCNKPVQWGWINMHTKGPMMGPGGWYGTNTNDSGVFNFGGVAAGDYVIEYQPGWGSPFSMVSETITISAEVASGTALNLNTDTSVVTGTAAPRSGDTIRLSLPQLRGTVVKTDGTTPVQNAWIMVFNPSNWDMQPRGANTDSAGKFSIGGLTEGITYNMEVNMPWGEGLVAPSDLTVTVTNNVGTISGTGVANNIITLSEPTKTLSGLVFKDADNDSTYDAGETLVANARVEAHKDMGGGFVETRTASNGTYSLKLSGGSWWVKVRPDWGTEIDWVNAQPMNRITFASGTSVEAQTKNFPVLATNATISGYVKKADGTAVSNVWVDICQDKGMCNGRSTDSNGRFSIKVSAGTYRINAFPPGDLMNSFGAPDEKIVTVSVNGSADAGTLTLKAKNSTISGRVQDTAGNAVQNVVVNVFKFGAPGWGMSFTDATGAYSVKVASGTWGVMVMPMSNQYVYQGGPLNVTVGESKTSSDNNFTLKLADATIKGKVRKGSAGGDLATDLWGGVWVKDTSVNDMIDFGGPMDDMMEKSGMMAGGDTGGSPMGGGMTEGGGGMGAGINNGAFELKVPAGTYELGLGMPPGSGYTLSSTATVTVLSDSDPLNTLGYTNVNLIVIRNDATISGHFYIDADDDDTYDAGEAVTGLRAMVNADKTGGGWQMTESNSATGAYSLSVAAGTWYIDAFIDPFMSFGASQYMVISEDAKVVVTSESTSTVNFEVRALDSTISGTVKGPDGAGMAGVWVFVDFGSADMLTEFKGPGGPGIGDFTDASGNFSISVAAGTYKIGAGIPPWDTRDLINPDLITGITVTSTTPSAGNILTFKASNSTISGTIYLDADSDGVVDTGEAKAGIVRAWSLSGRGTGAVSADGSYSLKVNDNDTWYLSAAADVDGTLYESPEATVVIAVGETTKTQNFALVSKGITIPNPKTASFDSSQSKTLTLIDGLTITMPAASIDTSGTVTVTVTPITAANTPNTQIKPDPKEQPIGLTYEFTALDSDGKEITDLAGNVTITMPYSEAFMEAAGISEESITPKYFDETRGTWENYDTVMRDPENNRLIIITDHFSSGGPVGQGGVPTAPSNLSATAQSSSSIALSWTDNSNNETGFKVYRAGTLITTTAADVTSYTDSGLSASTTYSYYVKATNASGDSAASNTASATTAAAPGGAVFLPAAVAEVPVEEVVEEVVEVVKVEVVEKPIAEMTIPELKAKIAEIIALIAQLQAQLAELIGYEGIPADFSFETNLKYGQTSDDVKYLQIILKAEIGEPTYPEAVPATGWFGPITKASVIAFQEKYSDDVLAPWGITEGTGLVGKTTQAKLNALLGR